MTHCDVSSKDARRGEIIHGKEVVKLKGKATRPKQTSGEAPITIKVPKILINTHKNIRLFIDAMHVNKLPFLHTMSENVDFRTATHLKVETKISLLDALEEVVKTHEQGGFKVKHVDADMQFE